MRNLAVELLPASEIVWPFDGDGQPCYLVPDASYKRQVKIDPFPAYAHDLGVVRDSLDRASAFFPLSFPLNIFVLERETQERTNGWFWSGIDYSVEVEEGQARPVVGTIILLGKRIPPHPAVTRYLVPHEYGHAVQLHIERQEYQGPKDPVAALMDEYAALRGYARPTNAYGGGTWHASLGEIFANDFRILVAHAEIGYWPHPGVERPEGIPGLNSWWMERAALATGKRARRLPDPEPQILKHGFRGKPVELRGFDERAPT